VGQNDTQGDLIVHLGAMRSAASAEPLHPPCCPVCRWGLTARRNTQHQPATKLPHLYGTWRFISMLTSPTEPYTETNESLHVITPYSIISILDPDITRRLASPGMLRHVAHVRTDVSEELSPSFIRATRIGELGTLA
jgi:hypothetical protein